MPNVMAALLNIGGASAQCRSLADAPTRVPCNNAVNIGARKTWMQSEFCTWKKFRYGTRAPENEYMVYQPRRQPKMCEVWLASTERRHCSNTAKTWNLLKFAGVPQTTNRSQSLVGQSSPYCEDMWGRHCHLTTFFPIVDMCLSCEYTVRQNCVTVPRWRIFGDFLRLVFSASRVQHVSDLHLKFALRPHHVWKCDRHPSCNGWD